MGDSMSHFRTAVFGIEVMRRMIFRDGPSICAQQWMTAVPEAYWDQVISAAARAFIPYAGRQLTDDYIASFVGHFHLEIWSSVTPVTMELDMDEASRLLALVSDPAPSALVELLLDPSGAPASAVRDERSFDARAFEYAASALSKGLPELSREDLAEWVRTRIEQAFVTGAATAKSLAAGQKRVWR